MGHILILRMTLDLISSTWAGGSWVWGAWAWGGWVWGRDYLTLDCPMTKVEAARKTSKQSREGSLGLAQQELTKKKYFVILAGLFLSVPVCVEGVWIRRSLRFARVCWGLPFSGLRIRCAPWAADGVHLPQPVF